MVRKIAKPRVSTIKKAIATAPAKDIQRSKQAHAVANTLAHVRAKKRQRIDSPEDRNTDPGATHNSQEVDETLNDDNEEDEDEDDGDEDEDNGDDGDDGDDNDNGEDELTKARREVAEMRKYSKAIMAEMAAMRSLFAGQTTLGLNSKGASRQPSKDLIPAPAKRSQLCVDEVMLHMGIAGDHGRWLEARSQSRDIVSKAGFDWGLPWGKQDPGIISDASQALRQSIPEFERFAHNWGAEHLVQETFSHRRNRLLAAAKGAEHKDSPDDAAPPAAPKLDKRKRAYKAAHPEIYGDKDKYKPKSKRKPSGPSTETADNPPPSPPSPTHSHSPTHSSSGTRTPSPASTLKPSSQPASNSRPSRSNKSTGSTNPASGPSTERMTTCGTTNATAAPLAPSKPSAKRKSAVKAASKK
ncbi:hypothetical protein FRC07_002900 [Ceratobasidium sp. 392]|nr:hypothetical protein FRC07_002900 [Ceratobasidium sp. 392]